MKRSKIRVLVIMLSCLVLIAASPLTTVFALDTTIAEAEKELQVEQQESDIEEKIFYEDTIEGDFAEDSVIVVLDKQTGGINKKHEAGFFGDYKEENIKDLTVITGDVKSKKYLNADKFRQIFRIKLPKVSEKTEENKKNVLDTVRKLEKQEGILYAGPNRSIGLTSSAMAGAPVNVPSRYNEQ